MEANKIKKFMELGGQEVSQTFQTGSEDKRKLGAQLLLSEVLEYVIQGLGLTPEINGVKITSSEEIEYHTASHGPDRLQMLDGLADVAYTMYWNASAFGVPLEEGFELVCDNNLEKFVRLQNWRGTEKELSPEQWHCNLNVRWPQEVVKVEVIQLGSEYYAVGKDTRGKVRKPSTYQPVNLEVLI